MEPELMLRRVVPNALSVFRALLLIPLFLVLRLDADTSGKLILALLVVAGLTDFFDGYLARRWGFSSQWGRILDPLADKILAGGLVLALVLEERIPVWFCLMVIGRDILILTASALLISRFRLVKGSNTVGKWAFTFILVTLISAILNFSRLTGTLIIISTVLIVFSIMSYGYEFIKLNRRRTA